MNTNEPYIRIVIMSVLTVSFMVLFSAVAAADATSAFSAESPVTVTADQTTKEAMLQNGYLVMKFNGNGTGYSMVWKKTGAELIGPAKGCYLSVDGGKAFVADNLEVVTGTPDMADIAYRGTWGTIHYVLRRGISGFYSYFEVSDLASVHEFRTLYRFDGALFRNGYTSVKQGPFPHLDDLNRGTKLQDETWQLMDGTVYTKYDWADYESNDLLHGVYGSASGAWMIPVSSEYYTSGPLRQELMVHLESRTGDAVLLNMLKGSHFGIPPLTIPSGYLYGPWFIYINNGDIADAVKTARQEQWPCLWLKNKNYPLNRSSVTGMLTRSDRKAAVDNAEIVLAQPGGDIYEQNGYIFSALTDSNGHFTIPNVRPGSYTLYAYSTDGQITGQFEKNGITVTEGKNSDLGTLEWETESGTVLWSIGIADRKCSEFRFGNLSRQYGLPALVPADLVYDVATGKPAQEWYYAQTKPGRWNITFTIDRPVKGDVCLLLPVAGVSRGPVLEVEVNGNTVKKLDYTNVNDQAAYRSANQSAHWRDNKIIFPGSMLKEGKNIVSLVMKTVADGGGIMYDYIALETAGNLPE
jgi:rhamnogalacturonan endolyase